MLTCVVQESGEHPAEHDSVRFLQRMYKLANTVRVPTASSYAERTVDRALAALSVVH